MKDDDLSWLKDLMPESDDDDLSWLELPVFEDTQIPTEASKPIPLGPSAPTDESLQQGSTLDCLLDEFLTSNEKLEPPPKKQRLSKRIVPKIRTMRSVTPDRDYGWNPEGTMFRGCVGVQVNGEPKYKNWTKEEVTEKLNKMIRGTWKWTEKKRSDCNLSRWLLKVLDTYGTDEFNPRDVEIFKLAHKKGKGSRKNSVPGSARYYPPYDALCSGYEISCCPFMVTDNPSHTKMRLSPVFVECLKANRLL